MPSSTLNTPYAVLFDLDGTLVDTALDFIALAQRMRRETNLPEMDSEAINTFRSTASSGARAMMRSAFQIDDDHPTLDGLVGRFLGLYADHCTDHSQLFPQLDNLLDHLDQHQIPWGVVTNKPEKFAKPLLAGLNLAKRCHCLICPDHVEHSKPHPESILLALQTLGIPASKNSLYIGDHQRDIESGQRAGLTTIAAAYGYLLPTDDVDTWQADATVHTSQDLYKHLLGWVNTKDE